jgi:hypothetical protein
MMKPSPDVRYQAEAAATVAAERVLFPLDLAVRKPTHGVALAAARTVIGQLETEAAQLKVGDFDIQANSVRFEVEPKGSVLLQLSCTLALRLSAGTDFWNRAEAVTRTLDLIQRFCTPAKDTSDVAAYTGQAQHAGSSQAGPA